MDHKEIVLKLLEIQVGIIPPKELSLDEALLQLDAVDPEMKHSMRFHRAAKFITDLLANSASEIERLRRENADLIMKRDAEMRRCDEIGNTLGREKVELQAKLPAAEGALKIAVPLACREYAATSCIQKLPPISRCYTCAARTYFDAAKTVESIKWCSNCDFSYSGDHICLD